MACRPFETVTLPRGARYRHASGLCKLPQITARQHGPLAGSGRGKAATAALPFPVLPDVARSQLVQCRIFKHKVRRLSVAWLVRNTSTGRRPDVLSELCFACAGWLQRRVAPTHSPSVSLSVFVCVGSACTLAALKLGHGCRGVCGDVCVREGAVAVLLQSTGSEAVVCQQSCVSVAVVLL